MKKSREDLNRIVRVMYDIADHKVKESEWHRAHIVSQLETINRLHPAMGKPLSGFEASVRDAALRKGCARLMAAEHKTSEAMLDAKAHYAKLIYLRNSR